MATAAQDKCTTQDKLGECRCAHEKHHGNGQLRDQLREQQGAICWATASDVAVIAAHCMPESLMVTSTTQHSNTATM